MIARCSTAARRDSFDQRVDHRRDRIWYTRDDVSD